MFFKQTLAIQLYEHFTNIVRGEWGVWQPLLLLAHSLAGRIFPAEPTILSLYLINQSRTYQASPLRGSEVTYSTPFLLRVHQHIQQA